MKHNIDSPVSRRPSRFRGRTRKYSNIFEDVWYFFFLFTIHVDVRKTVLKKIGRPARGGGESRTPGGRVRLRGRLLYRSDSTNRSTPREVERPMGRVTARVRRSRGRRGAPGREAGRVDTLPAQILLRGGPRVGDSTGPSERTRR